MDEKKKKSKKRRREGKDDGRDGDKTIENRDREVDEQNNDNERKKSERERESSKKAKKSSRHYFQRTMISETINETKFDQSPESSSTSMAETKENELIDPPVATEITAPTTTSLPIENISKSNFFAQLLAREKKAPPIGTCHATGKKSEQNTTETSQDWLCPKCNTSNHRHSHQCQKCKAVKRLTTWR